MLRIGSLFAGIGGLELGLQAGLELEGVPCRVAFQVEQNDYCRAVLARHYPNTLRFEDVKEVNKQNLPAVDLICGGFPCQDISQAGKGAGLDGDRSGLYFEMLRVVREMRPRLWVMENVPTITNRGLDVVLRTMAQAGYDARWGMLRASTLGAPHQRQRWFCVGWLADSYKVDSRGDTCKLRQENIEHQRRAVFVGGSETGANTNQPQTTKPGLGGSPARVSRWVDIAKPKWPAPPGPAQSYEPPRTHHKQSEDIKRLQALGNSVVPAQAAVIGRWIAQELLQPA